MRILLFYGEVKKVALKKLIWENNDGDKPHIYLGPFIRFRQLPILATYSAVAEP